MFHSQQKYHLDRSDRYEKDLMIIMQNNKVISELYMTLHLSKHKLERQVRNLLCSQEEHQLSLGKISDPMFHKVAALALMNHQ